MIWVVTDLHLAQIDLKVTYKIPNGFKGHLQNPKWI